MFWIILWFFKLSWFDISLQGVMGGPSAIVLPCVARWVAPPPSQPHTSCVRKEMGSPAQETSLYSDLEGGTKNLTDIIQFQGTTASLSNTWWIQDKGLLVWERAKNANFVMLSCTSRTRQSKYTAEIVSGVQFKPILYLCAHQKALVNMLANMGRLKCLSSGKILLPLSMKQNKNIMKFLKFGWD